MLQEDRTLARSIDPETTWLTASARTTGQTTGDMQNTTGRGIIVTAYVNTAAGGGETLQVKLQCKDPLSGQYYDVAANSATTATGFIVLKVSQFLPNAAAGVGGQTVQASLPATWRIVTIHSASGNWTYSVQYSITY